MEFTIFRSIREGYAAGREAGYNDSERGLPPHWSDYIIDQHINFAVGFADGYNHAYRRYSVQRDTYYHYTG